MNSGLIPEYSLLVNNLYAPAGTRLPFQQSNPPLGWVTDMGAPLSDAAVRWQNVNPGFGGSTSWSSWNFGGTFNLNAFTLSTAQLPAHNHGISDPGHAHGISDPGHSHTFPSGSPFVSVGSSPNQLAGGTDHPYVTIGSDNAVGTGIGIVAAGTGVSTTNTGSGSAITPTLTTPQVKYVDLIVGIKS